MFLMSGFLEGSKAMILRLGAPAEQFSAFIDGSSGDLLLMRVLFMINLGTTLSFLISF